MAVSDKKRYRANEILSATLIELLLLIAFVLLLIIFIDNNQASDPIQKKRVCEGLLNSLEPLVGTEALEGIDCNEYEKHSADLLVRIIAAAKQIDQNQKKLWEAVPGVTNYPPIGTMEAERALDKINEKNKDLKDPQERINGLIVENSQLQQRVNELSATLAELQRDLPSLRLENTRLNSDLASLKEKNDRLQSQLASLERPESVDGGTGANTGVGPCLTSNPKDSRPSHDYLVVVDLTGAGYEVTLRPDNKHSSRIEVLIDNQIIPTELDKRRPVYYSTTQQFVSAFSKLKAHAANQQPKCGYQARYIFDDQDPSNFAKLVNGVQESFYSTEKVVNK